MKAVIEILKAGKWVVLATYESIAAATLALMRLAQKEGYQHENHRVRRHDECADNDKK